MMNTTIEFIFYSGDKLVIDPYEYVTEITFDYPVEKLYEEVINYKYQLSTTRQLQINLHFKNNCTIDPWQVFQIIYNTRSLTKNITVCKIHDSPTFNFEVLTIETTERV